MVNDGVYDEGTWTLEEVLAASRIQLDRNFLFHNRISVDAADSNAHILTVFIYLFIYFKSFGRVAHSPISSGHPWGHE